MPLRKAIAAVILMAFIVTFIQNPVYSQVADAMPTMSAPGVMVHLSPEFTPAYLKGIVIHPENALKFDFIIYKGDKELTESQKKEEYTKLTKYFLASLAIPDDDQWVNLSPYEKDRIIKDNFGKTEMGRDLLAQDYMLKQITASLIYPEDHLGRKFWDKVYSEAQKQYGTTNIPVNTFNKVWILPDDALIYEKGNTAYVIKNHLKVMLEEDYLALQKHSGIQNVPKDDSKTHTVASKIVKEIVLPELEREVNEGQNFSALRQVYSGMLLATWYKRAIRESLLSKVYANKEKVKGVDQDPKTNEKIYQQYLKAYKKGVFNLIKEEVNKYTNETIPRKYFSGGVVGSYKRATEQLGHETLVRATTISSDNNAALISGLQSDKYDYAQVAAKESVEVANNVGDKTALLEFLSEKKRDEAMLVPSWAKQLIDKIGFQGRPKKYAKEQGLIRDDVEGEFISGAPAFQEWFNATAEDVGNRFQTVQALEKQAGMSALAIHLMLSNNEQSIRASEAVQSAFQEQRPIIVELGSGNTVNSSKLAQQNRNALILAADEYDSNPQTALADYLPYAQAFEAGTLAGQKEPNVSVVRSYTDLLLSLPDNSVDGIVLVQPARAILKDLVVLIEKFDVVRKLKTGAKIAILGDDKNKDYFVLVSDRVNFVKQRSDIFMGVDLKKNSDFPEKYLKGGLYVAEVNKREKDGAMLINQVSKKYQVAPEAIGFLHDNVLQDLLDEDIGSYKELILNIKQTGRIFRGDYLVNILKSILDDSGYIGTSEYASTSHLTSDIKTAESFGSENGQFTLEFDTQRLTQRQKGWFVRSTRIRHSSDSVMGVPADLRALTDDNKEKLLEALRTAGLLKENEERVRAVLYGDLNHAVPTKVWEQFLPQFESFSEDDLYQLWVAFHSQGLAEFIDVIQKILSDKGRPLETPEALYGTPFVNQVELKLNSLNGVFERRSQDQKSFITQDVYRVSQELLLLGLMSSIKKGNDFRLIEPGRNEYVSFDQIIRNASNQDYFHGQSGYIKQVRGTSSWMVEPINLTRISVDELNDTLKSLRQQKEELQTALGVEKDGAMVTVSRARPKAVNQDLGGIDLNSANLNLQIRRDGKGVPLPISQQNLESIKIDGLIPVIIDIKPAMATPLLSELKSSSIL